MTKLLDFIKEIEDYHKPLGEEHSKEDAERLNQLRMKVQISDALDQKDKCLIEELLTSRKHTMKVVEELKEALRDTVKESRSAQFLTKSMFIMTFLLGFAMFVVSIYFAFLEKEFFSLIFGGLGLATVITYFIANPPLKIQDSRSNYAQLNIGVLAWFNDFLNSSALVVQNQETIAHLVHNAASNGVVLSIEDVITLNERMINNALSIGRDQLKNTHDLLHLIDKVAEPSNRVEEVKTVLEKAKEIVGKEG